MAGGETTKYIYKTKIIKKITTTKNEQQTDRQTDRQTTGFRQ